MEGPPIFKRDVVSLSPAFCLMFTPYHIPQGVWSMLWHIGSMVGELLSLRGYNYIYTYLY